MRYDPRPGGPDGPPRPSTAETLGRLTGVVLMGIVLAFVAVALVWGIAWMVANFPS